MVFVCFARTKQKSYCFWTADVLKPKVSQCFARNKLKSFCFSTSDVSKPMNFQYFIRQTKQTYYVSTSDIWTFFFVFVFLCVARQKQQRHCCSTSDAPKLMAFQCFVCFRLPSKPVSISAPIGFLPRSSQTVI